MDQKQYEVELTVAGNGNSGNVFVYQVPRGGKIVSYAVSGFSITSNIYIYKNNVSEKKLNFSDLLLPLAVTLEENDKIQVYVKNNDATPISGVIMLYVDIY